MTTLKIIPIEWLIPGKYQPRKNFKKELLQELSISIKTQGVIEPLIVREIEQNKYEIIAGERRWRAASLAGLNEVPCLIKDISAAQGAAMSLIENIQRENLNIIEEARGYHRLSEEFHFKQHEIADLIGKSRSHVANLLRLLTLHTAVQEKIGEGVLSFAQARLLVGLSEANQLELTTLVQAKGLSVRVLEKKIKEIKEKKDHSNNGLNPNLDRLVSNLSDQLGAPVRISTNESQGGWLEVKFFDNETLAGLLERLGLRYD